MTLQADDLLYESIPPTHFVWCAMCHAEPLEPCRWTFGAGKRSRWEVHNDRREAWIGAGRPDRPVRRSNAKPKPDSQRRLFL